MVEKPENDDEIPPFILDVPTLTKHGEQRKRQPSL